MHHRSSIMAVLGVLACSDAATGHRDPPPLGLSLTASSRIVPGTNGASLQVDAIVRNETTKPVEVAVGMGCPLFLQLLPAPGADSLASFAAGRYGVNVAVTTRTLLIGTWAGTVQLPLSIP